MNLEEYFISCFNSKRVGDDGAVIDGYVYSKDAFFEGVHFKREWMSCYDIAKKAMMINISDAVAMNAVPKYALLSVAMPKSISKKEMQDLVRGFQESASEFGVEIIGGDTISNTKLDITITIVSEAKKPLYRTPLRDGYILAYTGNLGNSKKDLQKLQNLGKIHKKSKFNNIILRDQFISKSRRVLKAGMDISDGLYSDLYKMLKLNKKGAKVLQNIPKKIGCSGEEYEMLIAFDVRDQKAVLQRAKASRVKLNIFAIVCSVNYKDRCKANHF